MFLVVMDTRVNTCLILLFLAYVVIVLPF